MTEKRERKKVFDFSNEDDRFAFVVLIVAILYIAGTVVAWFFVWPLGLGLTIIAGIFLFIVGGALVADWIKYGEWFPS